VSSPGAPAAPAVKRGGWLAFLLSLVFPGAGQFFIGRPLQGTFFALVFIAWQLGPTAVIAFVPSLVIAVAPLTVALLGYRLLIAVHAARSFVEERRGLVAVVVFVALAFGTGWGAAYVVRHELVEPLKIPSSSMEPTLTPGDLFLAVKRGPHSKIERGAVVVYDFEGHVFVRRVIGLPGEKVELVDGMVSVNGKAFGRERCAEGTYSWNLDEQHHESHCEVETVDGRSWKILVDPGSAGDGVYLVPEGGYFVLGDNRGYARDSRSGPPLKPEEVRGVVEAIWASTIPAFPWVRLERFGVRPFVTEPSR